MAKSMTYSDESTDHFSEKRFITPTLRFAQLKKKKNLCIGIQVWRIDCRSFEAKLAKLRACGHGHFFQGRPRPFQPFEKKAVSHDFCVFWVLEAAVGKFKETIVGIKVVYGTNTLDALVVRNGAITCIL